MMTKSPTRPAVSALGALCCAAAAVLWAGPATAAAPAGASPAQLATAAAANKVCPDRGKWTVVADNRALKECATNPLEQGCMLSDGRKHGIWITYEKRVKCSQPASIRHFKLGRQAGLEQLFVLVCQGKGAKAKCASRASEAGPFKDDKRHGVWQTFGDDGRKLTEGNYFEGVKHGPWSHFNAANRPWQVQCYQDDKPTWKARVEVVTTTAMPCAVTREKKVETGLATVSASDQKASKLVRLAQSTPKMALRVRYLQKAVQLAPTNGRYKKLLTAAQAAVQTPK